MNLGGCTWTHPIDALTGFVEEIKEENRFDKAKPFPERTYWISVCGGVFTTTVSREMQTRGGDLYETRAKAEARAQLNAHIHKMGRIDIGDSYWRLVVDGGWVTGRMTRDPYELFADYMLPSFANDEDKTERVRLFNLVYNTNF